MAGKNFSPLADALNLLNDDPLLLVPLGSALLQNDTPAARDALSQFQVSLKQVTAMINSMLRAPKHNSKDDSMHWCLCDPKKWLSEVSFDRCIHCDDCDGSNDLRWMKIKTAYDSSLDKVAPVHKLNTKTMQVEPVWEACTQQDDGATYLCRKCKKANPRGHVQCENKNCGLWLHQACVHETDTIHPYRYDCTRPDRHFFCSLDCAGICRSTMDNAKAIEEQFVAMDDEDDAPSVSEQEQEEEEESSAMEDEDAASSVSEEEEQEEEEESSVSHKRPMKAPLGSKSYRVKNPDTWQQDEAEHQELVRAAKRCRGDAIRDEVMEPYTTSNKSPAKYIQVWHYKQFVDSNNK